MNDMSAPFTNCPESVLACCVSTTASNPAWGVSLSARSLPRRLYLGNIRPKPATHAARRLPMELCSFCHGGCHTTERGSSSSSREGLETRATAFRQLTDPLLFSFVG